MAKSEGMIGEQLIELAGRLPLYDDGPGALCYEDFFAFVGATDAQGIRQYCQSLVRDQKLVVLLACIWAKVQMSHQNERKVKIAAEQALNLLGNRPITEESLAGLMRDNRARIKESKALARFANLGTLDAYDFDVLAERLLTEIVG
ncbi:hypothetical protein [Ktedonospora formicarum]|uniref:Uncharacterized protein n=1 Tax=Ktedonospora formicarum TaxID=2778364 RepID=A0A8J3I637_9CHLR|nr:hypothetical protein [Ktedonospora formicarum]GHO49326.1 hypothetical protein KSX_74890 [Ktedonospora formicarum]